jgi:hypothetical protein
MLGHEDVKTTSIYLNATINELQDSMMRLGTGGQPLHDLAQSGNQEPPPMGNDAASSSANVVVN